MVQLTARRCSFSLCYKKSHLEESETVLDFLKPKIIKHGFPAFVKHTSPRGVSNEKKKDIISKLLPLMPTNRHQFWYDLEESNVPDLATDE